MDHTDAVRAYYNADVEHEWARIDGRPEFILTCRYLSRYIKSGDRVLDIGGGPGRYALWLAEKGCDVTLFDLSPVNVRFAEDKAKEKSLTLHTVEGDARTADAAVQGPFDHVLIMGPLYHLQTEPDRIQAVEAALRLLKPGGMLFASFINPVFGADLRHEARTRMRVGSGRTKPGLPQRNARKPQLCGAFVHACVFHHNRRRFCRLWRGFRWKQSICSRRKA